MVPLFTTATIFFRCFFWDARIDMLPWAQDTGRQVNCQARVFEGRRKGLWNFLGDRQGVSPSEGILRVWQPVHLNSIAA